MCYRVMMNTIFPSIFFLLSYYLVSSGVLSGVEFGILHSVNGCL